MPRVAARRRSPALTVRGRTLIGPGRCSSPSQRVRRGADPSDRRAGHCQTGGRWASGRPGPGSRPNRVHGHPAAEAGDLPARARVAWPAAPLRLWFGYSARLVSITTTAQSIPRPEVHGEPYSPNTRPRPTKKHWRSPNTTEAPTSLLGNPGQRPAKQHLCVLSNDPQVPLWNRWKQLEPRQRRRTCSATSLTSLLNKLFQARALKEGNQE